MKEYLISAIAVCAVCALVDTLSPDGKMGKGVSFALSVAVTLALISPLFSAFSGIREKSESLVYEIGSAYDGAQSDYGLEGATAIAAGEGISEAISEKFGIDREYINVECQITLIGDVVIFERVTVGLSGVGIFADTVGIEKYISDSLGAECEVRLLER